MTPEQRAEAIWIACESTTAARFIMSDLRNVPRHDLEEQVAVISRHLTEYALRFNRARADRFTSDPGCPRYDSGCCCSLCLFRKAADDGCVQ